VTVSSSRPLVSCILPTADRRAFVGQAIRYFQRQDYDRRELVVLDDGDDAVEDLIPRDPRIRYVRLPHREPLGTKRNRGCELAAGELVCHWDDDDWMAANRLTVQVDALQLSGADVCGAAELLHYRLREGEAWRYRPLPGDPPCPLGGTLLYRRSAWAAHPFPPVTTGEDSAFVAAVPRTRMHLLPTSAFYVAVLHGANTAAKHLADPRWQRCCLDDVGRLLAADRGFYAAARRAGAPPPANVPSLTVAASFVVYDGYGSMNEYLVRGMRRAGASVAVAPLDVDRRGLSAELLALLDRPPPEPGKPVLFSSWPSDALRRFTGTRDLFVHTMWEASRLPAGWSAALNRTRGVVVPTRFVADVCRASGVSVPVGVAPDGVDPSVYHYIERPDRPGPTTLMVATVVPRKHAREGIGAWKAAFAHDPDARLVIKSRFRYGNYHPDDPRITFVDENEPSRGIAHWYAEADILMALGSEGFGLPLVEGMATGLPVVALNSEGQSDVCRDAGDLLLAVAPARFEPADEAPFGPAGVRGVPDAADVAARLRWVAEHREEARDLGRAASRWALAERDVWRKGPAVLEFVEAHLHRPRPLRRGRALWTPSASPRCGLAEYSRELVDALRELGASISASRTAPDIERTDLVHLQHEPSLIGPDAVAAVVRRAAHRGVPVVVTEHAVRQEPACWEPEASALVVHSREGLSLLKQRWPGQRVEHVPHGCSTWFPPRKGRRGRVVATFGFVEPHKGLGRLLAAVAGLEGAQLLVYGSTKALDADEWWDRLVPPVPVRRETEFLPPEEVARRLAAEADVLVYWYDQPSFSAVSGAVRIGLASGVPVLTSRTRWFSDLRDVTLQPDDLDEGLALLLDDTRLRRRLVQAARQYCHDNSWTATARRHLEIYESLRR
jgi:glycosyltransferase involved in cell wall biosynthesis